MTSKSQYETADDGLVARVSGRWAQGKLHYAARYMDAFCTSMRTKWKLVFLDLMAGPGRCVLNDGSGAAFDGSPVLAAKLKRGFHAIVAVEEHQGLADALRRRLAPFPHARVLAGNCNDASVLEDLHAEAAKPGRLTLAFADMLGTDVDFESIRRLTTGLRVDVLITLQLADLTRNAGQAYTGDQRARFDRFFGTPDWAHVVEAEHAKNHAPKEVAQALEDFYEDRRRSVDYAHITPLHRTMKTDTDAPLYRLVLASKHALGTKLFHAVSTITADGQRELFD